MPLAATPIYYLLDGNGRGIEERAQLEVKSVVVFWWLTQGESCRLCWM